MIYQSMFFFHVVDKGFHTFHMQKWLKKFWKLWNMLHSTINFLWKFQYISLSGDINRVIYLKMIILSSLTHLIWLYLICVELHQNRTARLSRTLLLVFWRLSVDNGFSFSVLLLVQYNTQLTYRWFYSHSAQHLLLCSAKECLISNTHIQPSATAFRKKNRS